MTTLLLTLPLFAVVACGYLATKLRLINSAGRSGLNHFVYYFALPVLIFSLMARADLRGEFEVTFVLAWLCASFVLFFVAYLLARNAFRLQQDLSVVFASGTIYGNTGYFALPLVITALGHQYTVPIIVSTTIDLMVMLPFASVLLELAKKADGSDFSQLGKMTAKTIVTNPLIIAALLGAAVSVSEIQLPNVMDRFILLLGSAAAPCALFALGSSLVEDGAKPLQTQTLAISFLKLAVHPLIVFGTMFWLFNVNDTWGKMAVVSAAMPVAVTVYVLAQQYNTYVNRISASIVVSTAISVATLSFILSHINNF